MRDSTLLTDLADADTRTQTLGNTISRLYQDGRIDTDTLHTLITAVGLIRNSIRFATRKATAE